MHGHLLFCTLNSLTQPPNHLLNFINEPSFFRFRVSVIIAKICDASVGLEEKDEGREGGREGGRRGKSQGGREEGKESGREGGILVGKVGVQSHLSISKVEVDGLGMSNVKDPVWLGGKPSDNTAPCGLKVLQEQLLGFGGDNVALRQMVLSRLVKPPCFSLQQQLLYLLHLHAHWLLCVLT